MRGAQQAVGHGDAQHRRQPLNVKAVAQPQLLERVVVELAGEIALRLIAKLLDAFLNEALIEVAVLVHGLLRALRRTRTHSKRFDGGAPLLMSSMPSMPSMPKAIRTSGLRPQVFGGLASDGEGGLAGLVGNRPIRASGQQCFDGG